MIKCSYSTGQNQDCKEKNTMKQDSIRITADSQAKFNNNTAFCIGTGRMGLALQREYQ